MAEPGFGKDIKTMPVPVESTDSMKSMQPLAVKIPTPLKKSPSVSVVSSGPPSPRKPITEPLKLTMPPKVTRVVGAGDGASFGYQGKIKKSL